MKKRYMDILINIIGAVESGGQVYGERDYAAYAGKGVNSPNEKTCTLGWAQNYGNNARRLCQMIYEKDPASFKKADTAGIARKLQTDWERTGWDPTERERAALIAIITTRVGKRCQDALFAELMESYLKDAKAFGVRDVRAEMMWCEIQHLGGLAPAKRIFSRIPRPYTLDDIYASLLLDQQDSSNDNQVGDKKFQERHECCVRWIRQYLPETKKDTGTGSTEGQIRQKAIAPMQGWIGLSRATGTHHPIIDLYNSFRPLPRGYAVTYQDDYCATTVSAAGIKAGLTDIIPRECGCGQMIELFREKGRWMERDGYIPDMGDVIFYDWDDTGAGDCTGWPEHVGMVEEVSAGTITVIEGNMDGGIVGRRQIAVNARYIRGFGIPDYASKATITENVTALKDKKTVDILAAEVIAGIWGHGDERRERLTAAGYDYDVVQVKVNKLLG